MNVYQRSAAVAAVLFLGLAVWSAFVPSHYQGNSCGTWVSPDLTDKAVADQVAQTRDVVQQSGALVDTTRLQALTAGLVVTKQECDSTLSTRETLTWVGLAGALLVPGGILFIGAGRPRPEPVDGAAIG